VGYEFCVPDSHRVELDEDEYYDFELEGCDVSRLNGETVGKVQSVLKTGGVPILVVASDSSESMIPFAESIVVSIDLEAKKVVIDPPEGLLEL
jgi:16S rRNA processing protein RimM